MYDKKNIVTNKLPIFFQINYNINLKYKIFILLTENILYKKWVLFFKIYQSFLEITSF